MIRMIVWSLTRPASCAKGGACDRKCGAKRILFTLTPLFIFYIIFKITLRNFRITLNMRYSMLVQIRKKFFLVFLINYQHSPFHAQDNCF
jgi:hypothetical protein